MFGQIFLATSFLEISSVVTEGEMVCVIGCHMANIAFECEVDSLGCTVEGELRIETFRIVLFIL